VNLTGVIKAKGDSNAEDIIGSLQAAFEDKHTAGVILRINSPGGSPVQSGIINDEMRRLRAKHPEIPLHVVVEDVCASGGYYVAVAADKIFVDKASIVGSIGVLMDGFGFTGTMEKLGVERRLLTAGVSKGFLDPFSPENETDKAHARQMLGEIHQQFIDVVRKGRGKRLNETPEMFSGLMWSGARSIELGLVDGYGTVDSVARDVIKASEVRDFSIRQNFAEKFAKQFGADMAEGMANVLTRLTLR
jgi:protease-4